MALTTLRMAAAAFLMALSATPATAGRTVIDAGILTITGYCSFNSTPESGDCAARPLGFGVTIGGTNYDSFVVNGNGALSLGGPVDFSRATGTLSDYGIPVFSPLINNTIVGFINQFDSDVIDLDTAYVGRATTGANMLDVIWFKCTTAIFCGPLSFDDPSYVATMGQAELDDRQMANSFGMRLTDLADGFEVTYSYYPRRDFPAVGESETIDPYGFSLPGGSTFQTTGPFETRTFRFDNNGQLVSGVPEPATWLTFLIGFMVTGAGLRRRGHATLAPR